MGSYAEYPPREDLRPWVRLTWIYEDDAPSQTVQRIAPDGCPELIVHLAEPYEELMPDGGFVPQPRVILAGQMTRPIALRATGPVKCIALRFEPDGAVDWLGRDMDEATDQRLDVSERLDVRGVSDAAACRLLLEDDVAGRMQDAGASLDLDVRAEIKRLVAGTEADRSSADQRRMQRLFLKHVGVAPRMLQSIFRFRKVFDHAVGAGASWIDASLAAGYFDQPQMARDFRRFLDCTATEWAREQVELARSIAAAPS
ncbi:MAG: helix-turn-helix domain-containing protein [Hyphomonadaceae bacterium]